MQFTPTKVLAAALLVASGITAQDCLPEADFNATIQWNRTTTGSEEGRYMSGTLVDTGVQTCFNVNEGAGSNPSIDWTWDCIPGYSLYSITTNVGLAVDYCQPGQCNHFDVTCNYAFDDIRCERSLCA